jgi:hypothetical protein
MIWIPGYGFWPASMVRPMNKARFIGQAAPEFLSDVTSAQKKLEAMLLGAPIEDGKVRKWPWWLRGIGQTSLSVKRWSASKHTGSPAQYARNDKSDEALEVLVARELSQADADRLIPKHVNNVPVFVERSGPIVALGDYEVGDDEFAGSPDDDSTVTSHNWTGTRGGWLDYTGPEITPGGADDNMGNNTIPLYVDIKGETLDHLGVSFVRAEGGTYVGSPGHWRFILDPVLRVKLKLAGLDAPASIPANRLVCWKSIPSEPLVGGFLHQTYGFHCRAEGIPMEWDAVVHGRPRVIPNAGLGDDDQSPQQGASIDPMTQARRLAYDVNGTLKIREGTPPAWWLFTLPKVGDDGKPVLVIGVKGDVQPDLHDLRALPWARWIKFGVKINVEFVPPKGSNVKGTVAEISPEFVQSGMGSAPVDTVWPTSSPDWREPTGDGTGDDDPAMSGYDSFCPKCGQPATSADKCIPGSYYCANGHKWTPSASPTGLGQTSHGWPSSWRRPKQYGSPMLQEEPLVQINDADEGLGSAMLVAMPTGTLNFDRVTGYEGQDWTVRDWSLGDATPAPAKPETCEYTTGELAAHALGAVAGGGLAGFLARNQSNMTIAGASITGTAGGFLIADAIIHWFRSSPSSS